MSKLRFAVLVLAIGCSGSAIAQTADGRGACKADYDKYCAGTPPGGGRVVAAFYLSENTTNHLSAQVQMVTFEPLSHPDGSDADDALNFTNVLQVSAAGSLSLNFDNLDTQP